MTIVYLLIPIALILGGSFLWAFLRTGADGQFDDLDTPPRRILMDDELVERKVENVR